MTIQALNSLGQSLWYDNIQRRLLENGELAAMINRGDIRGVTSNPSIFLNAIAKTKDYDQALIPLAWSGRTAQEIFWDLAIEDIQAACDLFKSIYRDTHGGDGFVSLEVNPTLAHDTAGTFDQVRQLWERVQRPNLMVKIPATLEGIPAIRSAIAAGINVNVTLIFSIERYRSVMEAYISGLEQRIQSGLDVRQVASVASFFVSRIDTKVDGMLEANKSSHAKLLLGKAAIAYARLAYVEFLNVFQGVRFAGCLSAGCAVQRPLWASTSTKNPAYPDTMYVDALVGNHTVNTVPPQTLVAYRDHGRAELTIQNDLEGATDTLASLEKIGISMQQVTAELETEGVKSFSDAFLTMLDAIELRRAQAVFSLGPLAAAVQRRMADLIAVNAPQRLWTHDPTLWTTDPAGQTEIRDRLGWLDLPNSSRLDWKNIRDFVDKVRVDGLDHFLLLGMGGSSLAPEVLSLIYSRLGSEDQTVEPKEEFFSILDSTDPAQILHTAEKFPPEKTLYIVSSKSGGTAEVNALFNYFWDCSGGNGSHFIAITDPGTSLEALAKSRGFRQIFQANPEVGGRYSVLTHFGLVPAGLIGLDGERLLERAGNMLRQCTAAGNPARNPGLALGAVLGEAVASGRDKLTFLADTAVAPLGGWLEQLLAESSGKQGKGIIIVDGEPLQPAGSYPEDRLFVYLRHAGELDAFVDELRQLGQPVLVFDLANLYDLGTEFYRWQVATAFACAVIGVNAFDQPDVQDNKTRTLDKIKAFNETGKLEEGKKLWEGSSVTAFTNMDLQGTGLVQTLQAFLEIARQASGHKYVAINAYLPRLAATQAKLLELRSKILVYTNCATTLGFGPRFLHSTGQLHKGGPDSGLFLQITAQPSEDLAIPQQKMSFGVLERCQALGDYETLVARNRPILRLHLSSPDRLDELVSVLK